MRKPRVDIKLSVHGTIVLFHARSERGIRWLTKHVGDQWAAEWRYAVDIVNGARADGIAVEGADR